MSVPSKTLIAASLFASLGVISTAAVAGEMTLNQHGERTMLVAYSDLNLNSPAGQNALKSRINRAVKKVCGYTLGRTSLNEANQIRTCIKGTTETAMASMASPNFASQTKEAVLAKSSASR